MRSRLNILAWTILASVFFGMAIYLFLHPSRTGVVPNYRSAATHWWMGEPVYEGGTHGFLYFPQFITFFTPFHLIQPEILGEILWRGFGFGLFSYALWRLSRLDLAGGQKEKRRPFLFFAIVLLGVPASLASLNNGQTNLALSASLILATISIHGKKWVEAAVWLWLGVLLKPVALAPLLLAFAAFSRIRSPLLVGLLPFLFLGLVNPDFSYAIERWGKCLEKILRSYAPENLRVSDLFGMLEKAGAPQPKVLEILVRVVACLFALAYVFAIQRFRGIGAAAWALWVVAALVFTIFNPRAETNSYVLISPLLAFAAVAYWQGDPGDKWKGVILAFGCIGLMCDGMGKPIYLATDVWLKPLIVFLLSPLLFPMPTGWSRE